MSSRVSGEQVAQVVAQVSEGAEDPGHVASLVGAFMQRQPTVGHYVAAHSSELSMEGVVLTLLHASVIARCIELARGRALGVTAARDLDIASGLGNDELALGSAEPALASYLVENIVAEDPTIGGPRRDTALRLVRIVARAFLDQA